MPHKTKPWFPNQKLTYGSIYFFIKGASLSINPFNIESINEAKQSILREARDASPSYKTFIHAAKSATGLSETTIKRILYDKRNKDAT